MTYSLCCFSFDADYVIEGANLIYPEAHTNEEDQ